MTYNRNLSIFAENITSGGVLSKIYQASTTVANLGAASPAGQRSFVTDATVTASGNYGAIVAGGGANFCSVYSDGTNWRIG